MVRLVDQLRAIAEGPMGNPVDRANWVVEDGEVVKDWKRMLQRKKRREAARRLRATTVNRKRRHN